MGTDIWGVATSRPSLPEVYEAGVASWGGMPSRAVVAKSVSLTGIRSIFTSSTDPGPSHVGLLTAAQRQSAASADWPRSHIIPLPKQGTCKSRTAPSAPFESTD
jgi:hypothetical protein